MPEINVFTHEFRPRSGGAGMVCECLAESWSTQGKRVKIWVPEYGDNQWKFQFDIRKIDGLKGTRNLGCLWATAKTFWKNRKSLQNTHVHCGEPGPIAVLFYLQWLPDKFWKTLSITLHGSEIARYRRNLISRWLFKRLLRRVVLIHVLSNYNRDAVLSLMPEVESKIVMGFGNPFKSIEERSRASDEGSKVTLLCVARIHPRKGQLELLEAASQLDDKLKKILKIVFVGRVVKSDYMMKLRELSEGLDIEVEFQGGVDDQELKARYVDADIFALTSVPHGASVEGLGLVYLEASGYGLPILAHDIGGVSDVVIGGENGFLSDWTRPGQLTANIARLVEDPSLRIQLGQQGKEMAARHSWDRVAGEIADRLGDHS